MGTVLTSAREKITATISHQAWLDALILQEMAQLFGNLLQEMKKAGFAIF